MTLLPKRDVLVIDDDGAIRGLLTAAFRRLGVTCDVAADGAEALECADAACYAVMLVDLMMPRVDGEGFVTAVREREPAAGERPIVLLMTAFPSRDSIPRLAEKIQAVIQKPFDVIEIAEIVRGCIEARRTLERRVQTPVHPAGRQQPPGAMPLGR